MTTNPYHPIFWNINHNKADPQQAIELMMSVEQARALHEELGDLGPEVASPAMVLYAVLGDALARAREPHYLDKQPAVGSRVRLGSKLGTVQAPEVDDDCAALVRVLFDEMPEPVFCRFARLERA